MVSGSQKFNLFLEVSMAIILVNPTFDTQKTLLIQCRLASHTVVQHQCGIGSMYVVFHIGLSHF